MNITLLTRTKKKINSIFILSFQFFALCWLVIFPTMALGSTDTMFIAFLILTSGVFLLISILSIIINSLLVKRLELSENIDFSLMLNTKLTEQEIKGITDIEYSRNFILADNRSYEIDNIQAYKLYCGQRNAVSKIEIKYQSTKLLEFSPKEFFNTIMNMLWAAS